MNIKTLLKLELKNRMKGNSQSKYSWLKSIFTVALVAVAVYGLYLVAEIFFEMFDKAGIAYEALVILYTVFFLFMCFIGTSSTIKVLYYKGDNEILMRYPVSGTEVFVSKTLFLIITQFAVTAVIITPFLFGYAKTMELGEEFYKMIPVSVLFMMFISLPVLFASKRTMVHMELSTSSAVHTTLYSLLRVRYAPSFFVLKNTLPSFV